MLTESKICVARRDNSYNDTEGQVGLGNIENYVPPNKTGLIKMTCKLKTSIETPQPILSKKVIIQC